MDNSDISQLGTLTKITRLDKSEKDSGLIRSVDDAHLVYKRKNSTDRYDELWMYFLKHDNKFQDFKLKKNILAGTDIPSNAQSSADGVQTYELWYVGNIGFLHVINLPH